MQQTDTLIIGAGAAGLMAAMHLAKAGKKVVVLEATDRIGGRIHTFTGGGFTQHIELGAEFVHGELPVTLALLKEASIPADSAVGDMWRYRDGKFSKSDQFLVHYDLIIKKLNGLKEDITLDDFLTTYFAEAEYVETGDMLRNFAAGYDTADPSRFSAFAMRKELQSEDGEHQYRPEGGYVHLLNYLEQQIIKHAGKILLLTPVKEIHWAQGQVKAIADDGREFIANKIVIALPLGVLQANKKEQGTITFVPAMPHREQALQQMGMGAVIKILLQFDAPFWEEQAIKKGAAPDVKDMSYLFSNEAIPTWWTQTPNTEALLTGWLGGPDAAKLKDASDDEVLGMALKSLSSIYSLPVGELRQKLTAHKIMNWLSHPYTRGAYSYATVYTNPSRELLNKPEQNTIYFAGEAFYSGPEMGTVEAALANGKDVAELIIEQ